MRFIYCFLVSVIFIFPAKATEVQEFSTDSVSPPPSRSKEGFSKLPAYLSRPNVCLRKLFCEEGSDSEEDEEENEFQEFWSTDSEEEEFSDLDETLYKHPQKHLVEDTEASSEDLTSKESALLKRRLRAFDETCDIFWSTDVYMAMFFTFKEYQKKYKKDFFLDQFMEMNLEKGTELDLPYAHAHKRLKKYQQSLVTLIPLKEKENFEEIFQQVRRDFGKTALAGQVSKIENDCEKKFFLATISQQEAKERMQHEEEESKRSTGVDEETLPTHYALESSSFDHFDPMPAPSETLEAAPRTAETLKDMPASLATLFEADASVQSTPSEQNDYGKKWADLALSLADDYVDANARRVENSGLNLLTHYEKMMAVASFIESPEDDFLWFEKLFERYLDVIQLDYVPASLFATYSLFEQKGLKQTQALFLGKIELFEKAGRLPVPGIKSFQGVLPMLSTIKSGQLHKRQR